ncbi:MAG: hypothetical protein HOV86_14750 [Thermoactinospora sp.]|nr:hypothetical protein [Thermoactinospora sp.]
MSRFWEASMRHAHARLTFHARCLRISRVVFEGQPRGPCGHRWINRFPNEGYDGLRERTTPQPTSHPSPQHAPLRASAK